MGSALVSAWGMRMRAIVFSLLAAVVVLSSSAHATTYNYVGQPLSQINGCNPCQTIPGLTGFVTFDFDTTNFTGNLSLSDGDTATFGVYTFPITVSYFGGPEWGLSGSLYLQNGVVISADLIGIGDQQYCGPGPYCGPHQGETVGPSGDSSYYVIYNSNPNVSDVVEFMNSAPGTWTEVAAVPETSTWAMLLIGFAAIGFATYRRPQLSINPERNIGVA
jgi:hypothetical protein